MITWLPYQHPNRIVAAAKTYNFYSSIIYKNKNGNILVVYAPNCKEYVKQDYYWMSPMEQLFMMACGKGHLAVVIYVEKQGANIHTNNEYTLRWNYWERASFCSFLPSWTRSKYPC